MTDAPVEAAISTLLAPLSPNRRKAVLGRLFLAAHGAASDDRAKPAHPTRTHEAKSVTVSKTDQLIDILRRTPGTPIPEIVGTIYPGDSKGTGKVRSLLAALKKQN